MGLKICSKNVFENTKPGNPPKYKRIAFILFIPSVNMK